MFYVLCIALGSSAHLHHQLFKNLLCKNLDSYAFHFFGKFRSLVIFVTLYLVNFLHKV